MGGAASLSTVHAIPLPVLSDERISQLRSRDNEHDIVLLTDLTDTLELWGLSRPQIYAIVDACGDLSEISINDFLIRYAKAQDSIDARRIRIESHARHRALSLKALLSFCNENDLWNTPTFEVVSNIITPITSVQATKAPCPLRMCDLLDEKDVGTSTVFVSHSWGNPFGLIVAACVDFCKWLSHNNVDTSSVFFWVDTHAIIQHNVAAQSQDLRQLEEVIHLSNYTLLVLDDEAKPLKRAWCLYEISTTLLDTSTNTALDSSKLQIRAGSLETSSHSFVPCPRERIWSMFHAVNMSTAEATFPSDLEMIVSRTKTVSWEAMEGFEAVNWLVQRALIEMKFDNDSIEAQRCKDTSDQSNAPDCNSLSIVFRSKKAEYQTISRLGNGSYGNVWKATAIYYADGTTGSDKVCVKVIPRIFDNRHGARRIIREIDLLSQFDHINILPLVDVVTKLDHSGSVGVIMVSELMDTDLHRLLRSSCQLTLMHIAYIVWQMLSGLGYMHARNVIHRDIKPHNILINSNCDVKIGDMGNVRRLTKGIETTEPMTEYVVTRWYRAPELLLSSASYNPSIDIWAVGCIAAELHYKMPICPGNDYIHQINLITTLMGSFTTDDFESMTISEKSRRYCESNFSGRKCTLKEKLSSKTPIDESLLFLIREVLKLNPTERPTAETLLTSPDFTIFDEVREDNYFEQIAAVRALPPLTDSTINLDDAELTNSFQSFVESKFV